MKKFMNFVEFGKAFESNSFDSDAFIAHMEDEMSWNYGSVTKNDDGTYSYEGMAGDPLNVELKEAAKKIGIFVKVEQLDSENYILTIVDEETEDDPIDVDYSELEFKMDKYMPEDEEVQEEYHEILDDDDMSNEDKIAELVAFFNTHANDRLGNYMPAGGTIEGFAAYLVATS